MCVSDRPPLGTSKSYYCRSNVFLSLQPSTWQPPPDERGSKRFFPVMVVANQIVASPWCIVVKWMLNYLFLVLFFLRILIV